MPCIKLTYQIVKRDGQFVARFEDELFFNTFCLTRTGLLERIRNLTMQHIQCDVELDALDELNHAAKEQE